MKLTPRTIELMKNFSAINNNILLEPGKVLRSVSEQKHIFASAEIEEDFPVEFGIYDLSSFVATLSLFEKPELTFSEETNGDGSAKYVVISDEESNQKFKYFGSSKNLLFVMTKDFSPPPFAVDFDVTKKTLDTLLRAAGTAALPHVVFESDGSNIDIVARDEDIQSSNEYRVQAGKGNGEPFRILVRHESLKMISGNYNIALDGNRISCFRSNDNKLTYYFATETSSTYGS